MADRDYTWSHSGVPEITGKNLAQNKQANKQTTDKQTKNNNRESESQIQRSPFNLFEEGPYLGYFINWLPNISTLDETHTLSPHLGNF